MKRLLLAAAIAAIATVALAAPAPNELPSIPASNGVVRATPSALVIPEDPNNPGGAGCVVGATGCSLPTSGGGGGGGDATAANQTLQITAANTTNADLGPPGETACATDTGSCSLNALLQRLAQRMTLVSTTLGSPFQAGGSIGNTGFVSTGNAASGASDSGNPVKIGGVYNTTIPTFTNAQRGDAQLGSRGSLSVQLMVADSGTPMATSASQSDGAPNLTTAAGLRVVTNTYLSNGSTWDRSRSIPGSDGTGLGVQAVASAPVSAAAAAASQCFLAAASSGQCGTAAAHNLYMVEASATADSYIYVFNATSAPTSPSSPTFGSSSGNYSRCFKVLSGATGSIGSMVAPTNYTVGIYLGVSSTACGTFTAATTANVVAFYK